MQIRNVLPPWLLESCVLSTYHTVAYSRTLYVKCEWAWTASLNYFLFLQNVIAVFLFSDSWYKNACKMLADLCPWFHQSLTKFKLYLCPDLVSFASWIVTKFWSFTGKRLGHSHSKLCPILCRLRPKLCPNFGRSRARLCPISFAPWPALLPT